MPHKRYEYDFNVIYNRTHGRTDTVSAFVDYIVEDLLEKEHYKDNPKNTLLNGYFADRDMLPGRSLFDENIRVIEQSMYTIIVLDIGFLKNSWSMYLNQLSSKTLIDKGPVSLGAQRIIPISLNLEPEAVARCCKHLCVQDAIYFKNDYRYDKRNQKRLVRVIRDGLPMAHPDIAPVLLENRGPHQDEENRVKKGDLAVGDTSIPILPQMTPSIASFPPAFVPPPKSIDEPYSYKNTTALVPDPVLGLGSDPVAQDYDLSHVHQYESGTEFLHSNRSIPNGETKGAGINNPFTVDLPEQPIESDLGLHKLPSPPIPNATQQGAVKSPDEPDTHMRSLATIYTDDEGRWAGMAVEINEQQRTKRTKVTSDQKETRHTREETHLFSPSPDVVPWAGAPGVQEQISDESRDPIQRCQTREPLQESDYDDIIINGTDDFVDGMACDESKKLPLRLDEPTTAVQTDLPAQLLVGGQESDIRVTRQVSQAPSFTERAHEMRYSETPQHMLMAGPPTLRQPIDDPALASTQRTADAAQTSAQRTADAALTSAQRTDDAALTSAQRTDNAAQTSAQPTDDAALTSAQRTDDATLTSAQRTDDAALTSAQRTDDAALTSAQRTDYAISAQHEHALPRRHISDHSLRNFSGIDWRDVADCGGENDKTEVKQRATSDMGYSSLQESPSQTAETERSIIESVNQIEQLRLTAQSITENTNHHSQSREFLQHDLSQHRWSEQENQDSSSVSESASSLSGCSLQDERSGTAAPRPDQEECGEEKVSNTSPNLAIEEPATDICTNRREVGETCSSSDNIAAAIPSSRSWWNRTVTSVTDTMYSIVELMSG